MNLNLKEDLSNLLLRGLPIVVKFLLFIVIPIYFGNKELGIFGLIIASLSIISTLLGVEIYQVTNRIFASDENKYYRVILSYVPIYAFAYLIILPSSFLVLFYILSIDISIVYLILLLGIIEHLLQEYYRLTIAKGLYLRANIFYFVKNGIWPLVFLLLLIYLSDFETSLWVIFVVQALILLIIISLNVKNIARIDRKFEFRLVSLSSLYYLGNTLSKRAVTYFDRFVAAYYFGLEIVGLITFYTSITSSLNQLLEAVTSVKFYKEYISTTEHKILIEKYKMTVYLYYGIFSITILTLGYFIFEFIDVIYKDNIYLLFLYFMGYYILNLSSAYHYSIYTHKKDSALFLITLITVFIYIGLISSLSKSFGIVLFPIAVIIYSILTYLFKIYIYNRIK